MKKRDMAAIGALTGGVAGYFAMKQTAEAGSSLPVVESPGQSAMHVAEGALVGGLLGWLLGGKR